MGCITLRAAAIAGMCLMGTTAASAHGTSASTVSATALQTVYRSPQVLVQAATLPSAHSKARALPIQVVIDGLGVPLLLPGGATAASAVVRMQVRCQSSVWAVERLSAFDGPGGSGAMRANGETPAGQLSWNRFQPHAEANAALLVWLAQAANQQCNAVANASTS